MLSVMLVTVLKFKVCKHFNPKNVEGGGGLNGYLEKDESFCTQERLQEKVADEDAFGLKTSSITDDRQSTIYLNFFNIRDGMKKSLIELTKNIVKPFFLNF